MFVSKQKYNNLKKNLKSINDIKIKIYQKNIEYQKEILRLKAENKELKEEIKQLKEKK